MAWQDNLDKLFNEFDEKKRKEKIKLDEVSERAEEKRQKENQYYENIVKPAFDQLEKKFGERYKVNIKQPRLGEIGYTILISPSTNEWISIRFFIDQENPKLEIRRSIGDGGIEDFKNLSHYSQVTEEHICQAIVEKFGKFMNVIYADK
jgi:hypothetical protein